MFTPASSATCPLRSPRSRLPSGGGPRGQGLFHHYRLKGRSTVRIHTGEGRDSRTDLFQDRRNYVWDNRSDTATLRNDHGRFIDDASWGHHHGGGRHHR
jgi:hypothetical protein